MKKGDIISVGLALITCAVLIGGVSIWLGDESKETELTTIEEISPITKTEEETLKTEEEKPKIEIKTPLSPEALQAYEVAMTNKNNPTAEFVTNKGTFTLELFEDTMPITVGNFIKLAKEGFYNGTQFHRVIPNFMIQGGDPITKTKEYLRYGTGGPGYAIPDEHILGEYLTNVRGTISMANSGPNSGGSQFFINVADNIGLDFDKEPLTSKHPVFGRVLNNMVVIDKIAQVETNDRDLPNDSIIIENIKISK